LTIGLDPKGLKKDVIYITIIKLKFTSLNKIEPKNMRRGENRKQIITTTKVKTLASSPQGDYSTKLRD